MSAISSAQKQPLFNKGNACYYKDKLHVVESVEFYGTSYHYRLIGCDRLYHEKILTKIKKHGKRPKTA